MSSRSPLSHPSPMSSSSFREYEILHKQQREDIINRYRKLSKELVEHQQKALKFRESDIFDKSIYEKMTRWVEDNALKKIHPKNNILILQAPPFEINFCRCPCVQQRKEWIPVEISYDYPNLSKENYYVEILRNDLSKSGFLLERFNSHTEAFSIRLE